MAAAICHAPVTMNCAFALGPGWLLSTSGVGREKVDVQNDCVKKKIFEQVAWSQSTLVSSTTGL